MVTFPMTLTDH